MTTYTQTLVKNAERKNKKNVREFLFSLFEGKNLNKIVGLAGPFIENYLNFCNSKGFTEFEIYEKDPQTIINQLSNLNQKVQLKLKDITEADSEQPNTLYDLDFCGTVRYLKEPIAKFKDNFIMTFSIRISLAETLDTFFSVRDEKVIKTYVKTTPLKHIEYHTDKGKYIHIVYRDTSNMCCFAKIA